MAWLVYHALRNMCATVRLSAAGIAGTLTNTFLVIGAIALRLGVPFFATLASVSLNVAIELIVAAVLVVAVVSALRGYTGSRAGSTV